MQSQRKKTILSKTLIHFVLMLVSASMIFPFLWMISTSLKTLDQVFSIPPKIIPEEPQWHNYIDSWNALPFTNAYINSFKIAIIAVLGQIITCSMAAYALAKINFKGKSIIFMAFIATMMIPGQVTMIPQFILFKYLGWIDTHLPLTVPWVLFSAFGVFLLRQFIMSLPNDLDEAAIIDGANHFIIYTRIILPLIMPSLATLGIFTFMASWNNFLAPLIYLNTPEKYTVPLLLAQFKGIYITDWTLLMAAATTAIIPILIVYLFGQKYIIESIALTGIKA
ncbi:carbohydrate ABC transporter permease [Caldicellulosiruptoraceae bacterium PP1]